MKPNEKEKTWSKVHEAQELVIADLKTTEIYKKYDPEQLEAVADVSEPEGTGTDSDGSIQLNLKFNQGRKKRRQRLFDRSGSRSSENQISEENESYSQSGDSDAPSRAHRRDMNSIQAKLDKNQKQVEGLAKASIAGILDDERRINQ